MTGCLDNLETFYVMTKAVRAQIYCLLFLSFNKATDQMSVKINKLGRLLKKVIGGRAPEYLTTSLT